MRKSIFFLQCLLVTCVFFFEICSAANIDATAGYMFTSHAFSNGEHAFGHVSFKNGFSVPSNGRIFLDIGGSVAGALELNGTGTIELRSDLHLGTTASFPSGGGINGKSHCLVLTGSLVIPASKRLKIVGDTVIDGQGHDFIIEDRAQLLIDASVTLTLRNLILKNNTKNVDVRPSLVLLTQGSKLALDNVELALASDLTFTQGKLFIHNDVAVSGTSLFSFRSTETSYIASSATLYFDHGTTFSYSPRSKSKDLIQMADRSSVLYLNGCTLFATTTGLRLTKGQLWLDNKVTLSSAETQVFSHAITFGNQLLGSAYDLDVHVLSGARVEVHGLIHDDSV